MSLSFKKGQKPVAAAAGSSEDATLLQLSLPLNIRILQIPVGQTSEDNSGFPWWLLLVSQIWGSRVKMESRMRSRRSIRGEQPAAAAAAARSLLLIESDHFYSTLPTNHSFTLVSFPPEHLHGLHLMMRGHCQASLAQIHLCLCHQY